MAHPARLEWATSIELSYGRAANYRNIITEFAVFGSDLPGSQPVFTRTLSLSSL